MRVSPRTSFAAFVLLSALAGAAAPSFANGFYQGIDPHHPPGTQNRGSMWVPMVESPYYADRDVYVDPAPTGSIYVDPAPDGQHLCRAHAYAYLWWVALSSARALRERVPGWRSGRLLPGYHPSGSGSLSGQSRHSARRPSRQPARRSAPRLPLGDKSSAGSELSEPPVKLKLLNLHHGCMSKRDETCDCAREAEAAKGVMLVTAASVRRPYAASLHPSGGEDAERR
ncbi:hypothetical protein ABIA18_002787 [Sinorhizobium fredii]